MLDGYLKIKNKPSDNRLDLRRLLYRGLKKPELSRKHLLVDFVGGYFIPRLEKVGVISKIFTG